ncbi:D-Ala-D-Ala carboxypeptidase [Marivirga lumbricoides]|uniref:D-Ala-D-Ala carboxypeptidase n=2 Tax=Marivirga lumbricoides TaxID=1046115 RepID=A0ABQ1LGR8_9BACT|nr:D-Ala-D-Ala carboxypeptidase [Marivirga lumbricoides]
MDSLFNAIEREDQGMGSVAILKNSELIYNKSYGYSDFEKQKKAEAKTIYRIGSISKTFTATLVMLAVEDGSVKLDDPLANFYPQFPNSKKITIEHLLRHQSGLYNFTNSPEYASYMNEPLSKEEVLRKLMTGGFNFAPGEKLEYSNTGYVLLSYILEDIYKKPYEQILTDKITRPLKLDKIKFGHSINAKAGEAYSYQKQKQWEKLPETYTGIPMGAGAVVSNAEQLSKFFNALFSGKIVSDSSLQKMKQLENNVGIGLFPIPFGNKMALGHNGGIDGFQSVSVYFPEENISFTILHNAVAYPINSILIGMLSIYFNIPYKIPSFKAVEVSAEELEALTGIYSSESFPLKITISAEGNQLMAQATGQPSFPLTAETKKVFKFDAAGLKITFNPEEEELQLEQMNKVFILTKEK